MNYYELIIWTSMAIAAHQLERADMATQERQLSRNGQVSVGKRISGNWGVLMYELHVSLYNNPFTAPFMEIKTQPKVAGELFGIKNSLIMDL